MAGGGNRPPVGGGGNIGGGNNINNGNINTGDININNKNKWNNNHRYEHWHNGHWNYGSWGYWNNYPGAWYAGGLATGWLLGSANYTYSNPYYVPVPVSGGTTVVYDYSQPIAAPASYQAQPENYAEAPAAAGATAPGAGDASAAPSDVPPEATQAFDAARAAFKKGDYATAQKQVEAAIQVMPDDAVLHEFRALCLFAQGKYDEAAGVLYSVLAAGPGWDWNTLQALYPNVETYTKELRALENYVRGHQNDAAGHFVLAYQYLCLGDTQAATSQLQTVTQLQPKDQLSAALLQAMQQAPAGSAGGQG